MTTSRTPIPLAGLLLAGCFIEQPAADPRAPSDLRSGGTTRVQLVQGDPQVDPRTVGDAVAAVSSALGRCFVGSGQVDLVVALDTEGRATGVQGPGDVQCLLPALQQGRYPRTAVPSEYQVSLWVQASAPGAVDAATEGAAEPVPGSETAAGPTTAAEPAPPDVLLVTVAGVRVDERRPDGRAWDEDGTGAPDLVIKLFRNDVEVLRTEVVPDSSIPAFGTAHARSLRMGPSDVLRFEIYDDDDGTLETLSRFEVPAPTPAHAQRGIWEIGAAPPMQLLTLRLAPPRSLVGTGIRWELRRGALEVLEVALDSPAAVAGIHPGDRIHLVDGRRVRGQTAAALEAGFRGEAGTHMRLEVEHEGQRREVELERRVIYY